MYYTGAASRQAHVSTINEKNVRETYVKNRPNVVLVLDYSTSMVTRDSGYTETRQQRLKSIINFLLDTLPIRAEFLGDDKELFVDNVDLGVVLFAGTAFESVAIDKGEDVKEEIRALLDSPLRRTRILMPRSRQLLPFFKLMTLETITWSFLSATVRPPLARLISHIQMPSTPIIMS